MVDSIGSRPATGTVAATAAAPRIERVATRKDETVAAQLELSAVAFELPPDFRDDPGAYRLKDHRLVPSKRGKRTPSPSLDPKEIAALKANDVVALERATVEKLAGIEAVAAFGEAPAGPELRALAEEAHRLNETCRIYVNLMAANVRRRLQNLTGAAGAASGYRAGMGLAAYA